jgi:hypothetical protein
MPQKGSEYWSAKQTMESEPFIFVIRYQSGIKENMRVLFHTDGGSFNIKSVVNRGYRNTELLLVCERNELTEFTYSASSMSAAGSVIWTTTAYADTQTRYKKTAGSTWTTQTAEDTSGVLSHNQTIDPDRIDESEQYEYQIRSTGQDDYTPGWSDSTNFYKDNSDIMHEGNVP